MNIYVGNLAYSVTQEELREAFAAYGEVQSANLITDKFTAARLVADDSKQAAAE